MKPGDRVRITRNFGGEGLIYNIKQDTAWGTLYYVLPDGYNEPEPFTEDELVLIEED